MGIRCAIVPGRASSRLHVNTEVSVESHELTLPPDTESPRRARRFVQDYLVEGDLADVSDVAALLVSEVVTNAVLHAHSEVRVSIDCHGRVVRIEVADESPVPAARRQLYPTAATGRGMVLVDELAAAWGLEPFDSGKIVWFEVEAA